jgi:hypothetical protein
MDVKATPEEEERIKKLLFGYFLNKAKEIGLTSTNIECLIRYASTKVNIGINHRDIWTRYWSSTTRVQRASLLVSITI